MARPDPSPPDNEAETGPERTCAVTREAGSPDTMVRFVLGPDGAVVPDIARKLPGRGVWVTASTARLAEAVRKNVFARALKTPARVPDGLVDLVGRLLEADALQRLSLANKAGLVVVGAAKVEAAIGEGGLAGLIEARDGSPDGARKIAGLLRRRLGDGATMPPCVDCFESAQLDLALGRTNVIHGALKRGPAAEAFLARCRRFAGFRSDTATTGGSAPARDGHPGADSDHAFQDFYQAAPDAGAAVAMSNGPSPAAGMTQHE